MAQAGREVVIVEAVRTAVGRRNGALKDMHPVMLAAHALRELVRRAGVDPALVEDVVWGCVSQVGEQGLNIGRNAVLAAGFPIEVPATTVDRQCGSGQQAIHFAANLIQSGVCDVTIAGGVENMSRLPIGSSLVSGGNPFPPSLLEVYPMTHQGISAEMIAEQWRIPREELDEFSLRSHQLAAAAQDAGYFDREIILTPLPDGSSFTRDEGSAPGHDAGEAGCAPASLQAGRRGDGGRQQPGERRRGGAAADDAGEGGGAWPAPARAHRRPACRRRGPGDDAHRPDSRHTLDPGARRADGGRH